MKKTKADHLWDWCRLTGTFSKPDVQRYGNDNYYSRSVRTVQEWAEHGRIERISDNDKKTLGLVKDGNKNIAWWRVWNDDKK